MLIPTDAMATTIALAILFGVSIGLMAGGQYVRWRLGKLWDSGPRGVFLQLVNDRAQNVNAVVDIKKKLEDVHKSAGGMLQKLDDLKAEIETSIGGLKPLLSELKVAANDTQFLDELSGSSAAVDAESPQVAR